MRFGEIYSVRIPASDGREQRGIRPAIVVQAQTGQERIPTILIVPLTSQIKAADFPFTFIVQPNEENQLRSSSVVLTFQLRAIDKKRIGNFIGTLSSENQTLLKKQLQQILDL